MKIGFFSPYLDSYGGGERYVLTLAEHWSGRHDVRIFWDNPRTIDEAQKRLNLNLKSIQVVRNVFRNSNIIRKLLVSKSYDLLFFLSDGSIPSSLAKYNIIHFQMPFSSISGSAWKMSRYQYAVCNSEFTRDHLYSGLTIPTKVIYPPVDVRSIRPGKKTKTILSVGRFSKAYDAKKYDVLINAFREAYKTGKLPGWRYIIAGGVLPGDRDYFQHLKLKAKGLPVELYPNCPYPKLMNFYAKATLYWHASGFGESKPENMEHFGITTVEAMAARCIPIVFPAGGQTEIIKDGSNGFFWQSQSDLITISEAVNRNKNSLATLQNAAKQRALEYSKDRFCREFDMLLETITGRKPI